MAATLRSLQFFSKQLKSLSVRNICTSHGLLSTGEVKKHTPSDVSKIAVTEKEDLSALSPMSEGQLKSRRVRIFVPAKNAMQSGTNLTHKWRLEFETRERWENPLMGWGSTGDPLSNVHLEFNTAEEAANYCERNGLKYFVEEKQTIALRPKAYGANFSWNKKTRVSTK